MNEERKRVLDRSIEINMVDVFDGKNIDDVIFDLQRIESTVKYGHCEDSKFRFHYYGHLLLDVFRDETDEEYKTRMVKEQQARDRAKNSKLKKMLGEKKKLDEEAAEREEYERLKAKFG
jgi:hypothetical protein